jgi:hypothetical protein
MLFIQHNQANILLRRKHCSTRTDHHGCVTTVRSPPLIVLLPWREAAV